MRESVLVLALITGVVVGEGVATADQLVLDESCTFRRYCRFGLNRYSPELMKTEGEKVLGRSGLERVRRDTEARLQQEGINPNQVDWRDHVVLAQRGHRAFIPHPTPPAPDDWMRPEFDDSAWVRARRPFQGGRPMNITSPVLGQFDESMDLRLQQALYRARFIVDDPAKAGTLTLRVVYTGGVRVFLNGEEVARGGLPKGELTPDTPGDPYPAGAYGKDGERLRDRVLSDVHIQAGKLRKGVNILAVENRASHFHPVVLTNPTQANWGGPLRPWAHARLSQLSLRASSTGVQSGVKRPPGVQVWVEDVHHRTESADFLAPGEDPGTVQITGAPNGTYAAQLVIGTDKDLTGLSVSPTPLKGPPDASGASAITVCFIAPYPVNKFTLEELGDERGLDASFPTQKQLAQYESTLDGKTPCIFDHLIEAVEARHPSDPDGSSGSRRGASPLLPADTARPVWVSFRIPRDAAPGTYKGTITVSASRAEPRGETSGVPPRPIPVEVEIVGWVLPDPKDFKTFVGCEENPYGVAKQYGVKPWSDEHFRLMSASFRQLGRIGNDWLNVPVLRNTEFGNRDDSMVRWVRKRDGTFTFDFDVLDRYLDLADEHCGRPRAICFIVMHGMQSGANPPTVPTVTCLDERQNRTVALELGGNDLPAKEKEDRWRAFATALVDHMKSRGLEDVMYWGYPLEREDDPDLKILLARFVPKVYWVTGPHEMMANAKYAKNEQFYRIVADIRYQGGWGSFRDDQGWKSKTTHLNNPRAGGTAIALHTTSPPFAYRLLPDRVVAMGRNGFTRVGADDWAAVHYQNMAVPKWLTGMPVLFVLWPGTDGAESSVRFETMLEGIQEAEARIFIEQALDRGAVGQALAARARTVLADNFRETTYLLGNSIVNAQFEYHYRWRERSQRVYRLAAEVAKTGSHP